MWYFFDFDKIELFKIEFSILKYSFLWIRKKLLKYPVLIR